jgi:hypothetical protein
MRWLLGLALGSCCCHDRYVHAQAGAAAAEAGAAIGAAAIALAALIFTGIAAWAAVQQTRIQERLRKAAAAPYVWADVRLDQEESGVMLALIVGNSGPTVATNVKVLISPSLPNIEQLGGAVEAQRRLAEGIPSLPPGRTLYWDLGPAFTLLANDGSQVHEISITAGGPDGPIPLLSYRLDLADYRGQKARRVGNLNQVSQAIDNLRRSQEQ